MYHESYRENFGRNALPLGVAFQTAHDREIDHSQGIYSASDAHTDTDQDRISAQDEHELNPDHHTEITRTLADIESLINSNSHAAAAEELLKINIGSLPLGALDRFSQALDRTVEGLYGKDTYLNAQLATQSLTVIVYNEAIEESGISLNPLQESGAVLAKSLDEALSQAGGFCLPILEFTDMEEGGADQYNPQKSPDTGVLSRSMWTETIGNHRAASLDHGGVAGQHAYTLDLKLGF